MFQRQPPTPSTLYVASLAAAQHGLKSLSEGDLIAARRKIDESQQLHLPLFHSRQPLGDIILKLAAGKPLEAGQAFCQRAVSDFLPPTRAMRRLGPWLISRLHMRVVFQAAGARNCALAAKHLGPGLRRDPSWLLNRGVQAIGLRLLLARLRRAGVKNGNETRAS